MADKRIKILTEAEIDELYSAPTFNQQDQRFFFSLNEVEIRAIQKVRDRRNKCMLVVLLGYFKSRPIPIIPKYSQIKADLKFVAQEILPGLGLKPFNLKQRDKDRIYTRIFELLEYSAWNEKYHNSLLFNALLEQANSWSAPRALFDTAIEFLAHNKIAIPAYSTLQKLISQVLVQHQKALHEQVKAACTEGLKDMLAELISGEYTFTLQNLRQSARNFTGTELEKELQVYQHLQPWMDEVVQVQERLGLSQMNQHYYAGRVDYYGAKLKRQTALNQQLYLLSYLQNRHQQCLERIADGFIHHVRQVKARAKAMAKEQVYQDWQKAARNVGKAADVLQLFLDDEIAPDTHFQSVQAEAFKVLNAKDLTSVCRYLSNQKQSADEAYWQHLDAESTLRTGLLRSLFCCLRIEGADQTQRLARALDQARLDLLAQQELSHASLDQRLPQKHIRPLLFNKDGTLNKARYEWYLYLQIPDRLQGQLLMPDVIKYRALDADLLKTQSWKQDKQRLLDSTAQEKLMADPTQLIPSMATELNLRLQEVSHYLEKTDNRDIILRNKGGKRYWRLPTASKKHLVNNPFFGQMRSVDIADVLRVVDRDTGFIDDFEHVLGMSSKSRLFEVDLLAILIANATNQGIYGIAEISDRSYEQLRTIQANYLRLETLNNANDRINNATAKLPIFKHYYIQEGIVHVSADGQKFETKRETFRTRYSSKYFGTAKGLSNVSLNAHHMGINNRIIGSNEHESHYLFDLLMNNSTEIIPDVVSTDTHGVNHVNFALLDLFGYQFAPRYAKVGTVIETMFNVTTDKDDRIQLSLKKPINTKRIMEHWDTIQRIAVSLAQRKTDQATLVRKLSAYKSNHPLLEAFTEYNRLVKARYLLSYIDDPELRSHVQKALNRGEAYHQLRRAISQVNGDRFRGNSDEEIELWNECARLMANAIIYFNSKVLSYLLHSFEHHGKAKLVETIKRASPVAWQSINLKGKYLFGQTGETPDIEYLMALIDEYVPLSEK
ncbi:MAG: Tn3 family transposase [Ketobacter sp.]